MRRTARGWAALRRRSGAAKTRQQQRRGRRQRHRGGLPGIHYRAAEVGMVGEEAVEARVQHRLDHREGIRLAQQAEGIGVDLQAEAMDGLGEGLDDAGIADADTIDMARKLFQRPEAVAAGDAIDAVLQTDGTQLRDLGLHAFGVQKAGQVDHRRMGEGLQDHLVGRGREAVVLQRGDDLPVLLAVERVLRFRIDAHCRAVGGVVAFRKTSTSSRVGTL